MELIEPMDINPEARRLELIAEVIALYDKHLSWNTTAWNDICGIVINALVGKVPKTYSSPRQTGAYQILKKYNPALLREINQYVNGYGKVLF